MCAKKRFAFEIGLQLVDCKGLTRAYTITKYHRQEASQNVSLHVSMLRCNIVGNREQMFYSVGLMFGFAFGSFGKSFFHDCCFFVQSRCKKVSKCWKCDSSISYVIYLVQLNVQ